MGVGADREHQSLAVGVQQLQLAQRRGHRIRMTISLTAPARVSRRRRRSKCESSQLLIIPSSSQTLHCHRIGAPGSVCSTIIRPRQRRLAGRRRHGNALSQVVQASPAVADRTTLLRCSASRRTAPAVSAGRSRKWCRSVTNIFRDCTGPRSCADRCWSRSIGGTPLAGVGESIGRSPGFDDLAGEGQTVDEAAQSWVGECLCPGMARICSFSRIPNC